MPLDSYIAETVRALEAGAEEALVGAARQRRDQLLNDELGAMNTFNDILMGAH